MTTSGFIAVSGLDEVRHMLADLAPNEAANLARVVVQDIATNIAKECKSKAPVKTGNLKRSFRASRKKGSRLNPQSEVKSNAAKKSDGKPDGFYWKFIEYGTAKMTARPFIGAIKTRYRKDMPSLMRESFGRKLEQFLARKAKRAANRSS